MNQDCFIKFYLFGYESKTIGGIYFMSFVFFYLFFGVITAGTGISLGFWACAQMLVACALIGLGQRAILPRERLSARRCAIWGAYSSAVTVGFALGFGWFEGFPVWCPVAFCILMSIAYMLLWPAFYWQSKRETQELNEKLKAFQSGEGEAG